MNLKIFQAKFKNFIFILFVFKKKSNYARKKSSPSDKLQDLEYLDWWSKYFTSLAENNNKRFNQTENKEMNEHNEHNDVVSVNETEIGSVKKLKAKLKNKTRSLTSLSSKSKIVLTYFIKFT